MKTKTHIGPVIFLILSLATAHSQVTVHFSGVNKIIPDGNAMGVVDTRKIVAPGLTSIADVQVQLTVEGGVSGDLYCYLRHESGFVVLVNRPGRSLDNPIGYEDAGFTATFSSRATNDFHSYHQNDSTECPTESGLKNAGVCAPDGRERDPAAAVESSPRSSSLASFEGLNPNGQWTLFLADLSCGGESRLKEWGLTITGKAESGPDLQIAKESTPNRLDGQITVPLVAVHYTAQPTP